MPDSIFGLKVGDYIQWKGPTSEPSETLPKLIGKVIRINENSLGKEVNVLIPSEMRRPQ